MVRRGIPRGALANAAADNSAVPLDEARVCVGSPEKSLRQSLGFDEEITGSSIKHQARTAGRRTGIAAEAGAEEAEGAARGSARRFQWRGRRGRRGRRWLAARSHSRAWRCCGLAEEEGEGGEPARGSAPANARGGDGRRSSALVCSVRPVVGRRAVGFWVFIKKSRARRLWWWQARIQGIPPPPEIIYENPGGNPRESPARIPRFASPRRGIPRIPGQNPPPKCLRLSLHVVPRDVPAGAPCHRRRPVLVPNATAPCHRCRPVLVPNATDRRTHHVNCGSLLYAVCSVLVLVCGTEQRDEIAPRPIEHLVVVTAERVADREPRKQELVEEPHQDAKT